MHWCWSLLRVFSWGQRETATAQAAGPLQCVGEASRQRVRPPAAKFWLNPHANNRRGKLNPDPQQGYLQLTTRSFSGREEPAVNNKHLAETGKFHLLKFCSL